MKALPLIAALTFALATTAHAQMDQSQSQSARASLNAQEASAAQQQLDQNAANQQQHDAEAAARNQSIANTDAAYGAALHEHHRDVRAYHRAMRQWRADVAACQAGDNSRCDHPQPMQ